MLQVIKPNSELPLSRQIGAQQFMAELLRMTADLMAAREANTNAS
jgi:hypothetical protein